jgi:hypothetical protein
MNDVPAQAEGPDKPAGGAGQGPPDDPVAPPPVDDQGVVCVAFALGWQMAELYRPRPAPIHAAHPGADDDPGDDATVDPRIVEGPRGRDLPGVSRLTAAQQNALRLEQIRVGLHVLAPRIRAAGLRLPECLSTAHLDGVRADVRGAHVLDLHVRLLSTLLATDFRLGKAYGLGRALADTCRETHDEDSLTGQFVQQRIANILGWISDLTSALPEHAGQAVHASLGYWQQWVAHRDAEPGTPPLAQTVRSLRRQGEIWRSLLSGEKDPRDLLGLNDYAWAAGNAIRTAGTIVLRSLARIWWVVVALAAVGVALILAADRLPNILAGASALLASLGITWRTTSNELRGVFGKLEDLAWGVELDRAISHAVTLPPANGAIVRDQHGPVRRAVARRRVARAAPLLEGPAR